MSPFYYFVQKAYTTIRNVRQNKCSNATYFAKLYKNSKLMWSRTSH